MPEYVKPCKSTEELANGDCRKCLHRTFLYSLTKSFNMRAFFGVSSRLFKTIHFLTTSRFLTVSPIYNLEQHLKYLKKEPNSSTQQVGWSPLALRGVESI